MTEKAPKDIVERLMVRAQWQKQMHSHLDLGPKAWIADRCLEDSGAMEKAAYEIDRLRAREAELVEALRPFADHIDEMKFDLDNRGNELPDDLPVGWVYVTIGDFRRARALTAQQEGDGDD